MEKAYDNFPAYILHGRVDPGVVYTEYRKFLHLDKRPIEHIIIYEIETFLVAISSYINCPEDFEKKPELVGDTLKFLEFMNEYFKKWEDCFYGGEIEYFRTFMKITEDALAAHLAIPQ